MKRINLLFLGLLMLIGYACDDQYFDHTDYDPGEWSNFSKEDAKDYFEQNATDLSPLCFNDVLLTKTSALAGIDFIPQWDKAVESLDQEMKLIELPLKCKVAFLFTEKVIRSGKRAFTRTFISSSRLIIARSITGSTDMFVVTLIPSDEDSGNALENMDNFHYLGGGRFTGKVFCSSLEGKFIRVLKYVEGKQVEQLPILRNSDILDVNGQNKDLNYSVISIAEYPVAAQSGTYSFDEGDSVIGPGGGGIGSSYCQHGYLIGTCPIAECENQIIIGGGNTENSGVGQKPIREILLTVTGETTNEDAYVRLGMTNQLYSVPLYKVILTGKDNDGAALEYEYEAIRFGVKTDGGEGAMVVGKTSDRVYTVYEHLPDHLGTGGAFHAWRFDNGFLIHCGPSKLNIGVGALGCIEICHSRMAELNKNILFLSNAKSGADLARSGKFKVHIVGASRLPLIPVD